MAPQHTLQPAVSSPPAVQDSEPTPLSGCIVAQELQSVSPMFQTPTREHQAVSQAILAPHPTVSDMETDPNMQTEHWPDPQPAQPDYRQEHDHLVTSSLPSSMTNFSQELLTPWSCQGSKIFLDICSGVDAPLSSAVSKLGFPALSVDLLVDSRMDLLDDSFYEQLLRLCGSGVVGYSAASPSCTEYSLLKLRPGGPKAIRTPDMLSGVPNLTPEETQRLQDSATLLYRCVNSVSVTYSSGGHGHIEQPSGAMSWSEDCTQEWIRLSGCALILLAACAFHWNIMKTWLFASSFQPLAELAATCNHGPNAHPSIAGVKDEHGVYLSRRSAAYPKALAEAFASKISVLLTPLATPVSWSNVFNLFPIKQMFQDPKGFVDGGGLHSTPDWSKPPDHSSNLFRSVRDHWIPRILNNNWHKMLVSHFLQKKTDPPFSEGIINEFRNSLDSLLPLT